MPPRYARSARAYTGKAPGAPISAPPRMAVGFLSTIWPAQRADVDGWPSVAQLSILTGRPPIPPFESLMYLTASSAAWRNSGNVTGPDSRLSRPSTIGSPLACFWAPGAAGASAGAVLLALFEDDRLSLPPHPATSTLATAAAIHSLVTFTGLS